MGVASWPRVVSKSIDQAGFRPAMFSGVIWSRPEKRWACWLPPCTSQFCGSASAALHAFVVHLRRARLPQAGASRLPQPATLPGRPGPAPQADRSHHHFRCGQVDWYCSNTERSVRGLRPVSFSTLSESTLK